jgi:ribosomal protein L29
MAILASTRIRQTGEFSASTRIRQIRRRVAIAYIFREKNAKQKKLLRDFLTKS